MMRQIKPLSLLFVVLLAGCAGQVEMAADQSVPTPASGEATLTPAFDLRDAITPAPETAKPGFTGQPLSTPIQEDPLAPSEPIPGADSELVRKAIGDLAERLSIDPSEIELLRFEEVTWRDGSLGCPQPGMAYTQALVNGSLIVLRAKGISYEYHVGGAGDPFYCANPEPPLPPDAGGYGDS